VSYGVDWAGQFGIKDPTVAAQAAPTVLVAFVLFILGIPVGLIYKVQIAFQKAVSGNFWQAAGSLLSMGLIVLAVKLNLPVFWVVAGFFAGPLVGWSANTIWFFSRRPKEMFPKLDAIDGSTFRALTRQSGAFLLLTIVLTLGTSLDTFIISKVAGLESAGNFAIALRVSALLSLAPTMMYMPLWAANGEAIGKGDYEWVRRTVSKMTVLCVAITIMVGIPILSGSDVLFRVWLGSDVAISRIMLGGLLAWAFLQCCTAPRFMTLNSLVVVRPQIIMYTVFLVLSAPIKVFAVHTMGEESLPWVNCIVFLTIVVPWLQRVYRKLVANGLDSKKAEAAC
jgi:O-antigen/teichoic acid export membrane protein